MDRFITEILDCVKELSIDPYGNYVVQVKYGVVCYLMKWLAAKQTFTCVFYRHVAVHCGAWRISSSTNYYVKICWKHSTDEPPEALFQCHREVPKVQRLP